MQEDPKQSLYFAHFFFADHILSTAWLVFFAVVWWVYTPHDGRVQANSAAQKEVMESGAGHNMTDEERAAAAMTIWNAEKGIATSMIVLGWLAKVRAALPAVQPNLTWFSHMCYRSISQPCCTPTPFICARAHTALFPTLGRIRSTGL